MDNKLEDAVGLITAKLSVSIKEILTELINTKISLGKDVLTSDEAAAYMGVSKSYLYKLTMERKIPFRAVSCAAFIFFSPRLRDSRAFTPTLVPTAMAIIRFCRGNASDTAVRAFSLICATKILSMTL